MPPPDETQSCLIIARMFGSVIHMAAQFFEPAPDFGVGDI